MKKTSEAPAQLIPEESMVQHRKQGLALMSPLKSKSLALNIQSDADYESADSLLTQVRQAKSNWLDRLNPIIKPFRAGLDLLYQLRSDIEEPLTELEGLIKTKMVDYKRAEAKRLREAEEARQAEIRRLEAEEAAKAQAEARAKTKPMQAKLQDALARIQQAKTTLQETEVAAPIKVSGSSARKQFKWKLDPNNPVAMLEFLDYVLKGPRGDGLESLLMINPIQMNAYFKLEGPKQEGPWLPGIIVEEDITIAGRR